MQTTLRDIVAEIRSLEPFPGVALRVLEISGRKSVVPGDLIEVIQTDPAITAKVLKLCNSAYYGFQREVASLREAGNMLGIASLVNLVITSCANRYFKNYGGATDESQERLWKNAFTNALSARLLAEANGDIDAERAYTAGLLQNIGHLVLDRFMHEEQASILQQVQQGQLLLDAERRVLGLHHAEIGARLATAWGLPEVLIDTIRYHHTPEKATVDPVLTGICHLAETLTWAIGADEGLDEATDEASNVALSLTGSDAGSLGEIRDLLGVELTKAAAFLS